MVAEITISQPQLGPGLLVIADYPVGYSSGFGETLLNLLRGYNSDRLYCVHPSHLHPAPNKQHGVSIAFGSPQTPKALPKTLCSLYRPLLKINQFRARYRLRRNLDQVIRDRQLTDLLTVPVTPWLLAVAVWLKRRHPALRLTIFVMDDWEGHHITHGLKYTATRRRLLEEAVSLSESRFAVSHEMAELYELEFAKSWQVARNPWTSNTSSSARSEIVDQNLVLLTGDVNDFRFDAVLALVQSLERQNVAHNTKLRLEIMGEVAPQCLQRLMGISSVNIRGRVPQSEALQRMQQARLLYLPLAFEEKNRRISLYSLPTKLPEYLASGRPVLVHAPPGSAAMNIAKKFELRPRIESTDPTVLDCMVREMLNGSAEFLSPPDNAIHALREEFNAESICSTFLASFSYSLATSR